jgi:hypothetical protein
MKPLRGFLFGILLLISISMPRNANADLFGGDVVVLTKILIQAIQQLEQLRLIYQTGRDSHNLMRDLNSGIRHGLEIIRILNPRFDPGIYGGLDNAASVQRAIEDLYGMIPQTSEARLQEVQDRSASESIAMNGSLFRYADDVDLEAKRIIAHAQDVSPQGAAKLTAESIAILIGVSTQVLRTNSMMLKMMGQNMALSNRKEKLQASQFKTQYKEISNGIGSLPPSLKLKALGQ